MGTIGSDYYPDGIPFDLIVTIARQRRSQDSILIRQMLDIRDRYNGDVVIPLPDVKEQPTIEPPIPRLITSAIDGNAMVAASTRPNIQAPIMDMSDPKARKNSEVRRKFGYAKWNESEVDVKLYRSYRHLTGYGTCSWIVMPDEATQSGRIELRDPLTTYAELRAPDDVRDPLNVAFIYGRSVDWIARTYPQAKDFLTTAAGRNWDTLWDVIEWVDEDEIVIGILGPRMPAYSPQDSRPYGYGGYEITRWRNKAGMVPVACPRRVTLDRIMGQISAMVGTVDLFTRLSALEVLATEKHIFPDAVVLGRDANTPPVLVGGQWHDGRSGRVNLIENAGDVKYLTTGANPYTEQALNRLEGAIRETGGASTMFNGETPSALRTGKALSTLGSFAIDPRVEEMQKIQQRALTQVIKACGHVEKGYFGSKTFSMYTGLAGESQAVTYVPNDDLTSDLYAVLYPLPGADINQMTVALSQLEGTELASKRTARVLHPLIEDADEEERLIAIEKTEMAVAAGFLQGVTGGQVPLVDAVATLKLQRAGKDLVEAIETAHEAAQERQAAQAPPPGEGQAASPGQMPGLSAPGAGAEMQPPGGDVIPQPGPNLANFRQLQQQLRAVPPPQPTNAPANA